MSGYQEKLFADDAEARTKILHMLRLVDGNEAEAARRLGISYRSLTRYVKRLNLQEALRGARSQKSNAVR